MSESKSFTKKLTTTFFLSSVNDLLRKLSEKSRIQDFEFVEWRHIEFNDKLSFFKFETVRPIYRFDQKRAYQFEKWIWIDW